MFQGMDSAKEAVEVQRHLRPPRSAALAARQSSDDSAGDLDSPASIFDLNPSFFTHKKVLVRLDLNVPTEER